MKPTNTNWDDDIDATEYNKEVLKQLGSWWSLCSMKSDDIADMFDYTEYVEQEQEAVHNAIVEKHQFKSPI